ncbi:MAG TPA: hypothetical protein VLB86_02045 [Gaiellaceae bacterium]|nr:hypothetical protein [Gaiellaceae bacterium]
MDPEPRQSRFIRLLEFLHLRRRPPDIGVREPRRPSPSVSGGSVALEPPDGDDS